MSSDRVAVVDRIAILGGGPIGLACALLLAAKGIASVVIDARALPEALNDARLLALSRGSWEALGPLLPHAPRQATIRDVHVSSVGEFGATHLAASEFGDTGLGATVLYRDLLEALTQAVIAHPLIEVRRPCRAQRIEQTPARVRIVLDGGDTIEADLAVRAEGFAVATDAGDDARLPWAIVAEVQVKGPPLGAAFERFTREGPLALLPTPTSLGAAGARTLSLVWCMSGVEAERRLALPQTSFLAELRAAIGAIGEPESVGPRHRFALLQQMREHVVEHRIVTLGNAAQTLHPVAGQGFNLGLRDCIALTDALSDALTNKCNLGQALSAYAARRRVDRAAITALTRALPQLFAARFTPLALARGIGLVALDQTPILRRALGMLLMFGVRT